VKPEQMDEMMFFLDDLQKSGQINMFGAPRVLESWFDLSKEDAKKVWTEWTQRKEDRE
jgi:hypothetical protein